MVEHHLKAPSRGKRVKKVSLSLQCISIIWSVSMSLNRQFFGAISFLGLGIRRWFIFEGRKNHNPLHDYVTNAFYFKDVLGAML